MKTRQTGSTVLTKMPSIDRSNSPAPNYNAKMNSSILNLNRVHDYNHKEGKNNRYWDDVDQDDDLSAYIKPKAADKSEKTNRSHSIRQTVAGSFRPNDADSIIKNLIITRQGRENHSNYDMFNSYGSSNGFNDEKRLSDKARHRIKATFKFRDEVETADSDSFFSSKFSKFSVPQNSDASPLIKPNPNAITEMIKKQKMQNGGPSNFPSISKNVPGASAGFSLPSLK